MANQRQARDLGNLRETGGQGSYPLTEADLSFADVPTNDVSTSKHGLAPKAPGDTAKFLRGDGTWAAGAGGAPVNAKYVTTAADAGLGAEVVRPQLANYSLDTPPASPNAKDDEFDDSSFDAKWTTVGIFTSKDES